jgi:hypothetical protein
VLPAVKVGGVAIPLASVTAEAMFVGPGNVPVGSAAGAVQSTVTPLIGLPASVTSAASGIAKSVPATAFCGVDPLTAMME